MQVTIQNRPFWKKFCIVQRNYRQYFSLKKEKEALMEA